MLFRSFNLFEPSLMTGVCPDKLIGVFIMDKFVESIGFACFEVFLKMFPNNPFDFTSNYHNHFFVQKYDHDADSLFSEELRLFFLGLFSPPPSSSSELPASDSDNGFSRIRSWSLDVRNPTLSAYSISV